MNLVTLTSTFLSPLIHLFMYPIHYQVPVVPRFHYISSLSSCFQPAPVKIFIRCLLNLFPQPLNGPFPSIYSHHSSQLLFLKHEFDHIFSSFKRRPNTFKYLQHKVHISFASSYLSCLKSHMSLLISYTLATPNHREVA